MYNATANSLLAYRMIHFNQKESSKICCDNRNMLHSHTNLRSTSASCLVSALQSSLYFGFTLLRSGNPTVKIPLPMKLATSVVLALLKNSFLTFSRPSSSKSSHDVTTSADIADISLRKFFKMKSNVFFSSSEVYRPFFH